MRITSRLAVVALLIAALPLPAAAQDDGWVIERMAVAYEIQTDGGITAVETLDVDFRGLERHGIFRDFVDRLRYDETHDRRYAIDVRGITAADGRTYPFQRSRDGGLLRLRIGDPDVTISGEQTYRIAYALDGALNGFPDHDELYWNATGTWPVPVESATVTVAAPAGSITRVDCFQGRGAGEHCRAGHDGTTATFSATRALAAGEQMTIVVGLAKGAVAAPSPILVDRPRDITQAFEHTTPILGGMAAGIVAMVGGLWYLWWRVGRDRRFVSMQYLSTDTTEETVPLFGSRPVAVEFEPPDGIRPGQMGLLVDERADTLDVTATIIDMAVRGYLKITELPKTGWFGSTDWQLDRLKAPDDRLLEYERIVLDGLFEDGTTTKLSDLKQQFYKDLARAKKALYADALERGWFPRNPNTIRTVTAVIGVFLLPASVAATIGLGLATGLGLLGLPLVVGAIGLIALARAMPRRSARGREVLWRALGFARYIRTAEVQQQAFAERANIFTTYLPYAVALQCVDKWARTFKDIDLQQATAAWYVGTTHGFDPGHFSAGLGSFSTSVSRAMASTPGGSGGSGFSGGSAGGGGGGGGGGSW
ncbi:MAG: DUF2207 domain-containing protein [Vicinamibacterales bacterium]